MPCCDSSKRNSLLEGLTSPGSPYSPDSPHSPYRPYSPDSPERPDPGLVVETAVQCSSPQ